MPRCRGAGRRILPQAVAAGGIGCLGGRSSRGASLKTNRGRGAFGREHGRAGAESSAFSPCAGGLRRHLPRGLEEGQGEDTDRDG